MPAHLYTLVNSEWVIVEPDPEPQHDPGAPAAAHITLASGEVLQVDGPQESHQPLPTGENWPVALGGRSTLPSASAVQIPLQLQGEYFETPIGSFYLTASTQRDQEVQCLRMVAFLNCRQCYPSVHSWIPYVREFGLITMDCPFGEMIWQGLRRRVRRMLTPQLAAFGEEAEAWFYPPLELSRRNAATLPYSDTEQIRRYAPAYPCFAIAVFDAGGALLGFRFVCEAMAMWEMTHVWNAHPTRISITGVPVSAL